jgi:hypothetical protein
MKNESKVRVCQNKKCQKVLPEGYTHRYCEACQNKLAQKTGNVLKGILSLAIAVGGIAIGGNITPKK